MTGTYRTFLFGGALQLFKWDSVSKWKREVQPCTPLIDNSSNSRNAYKWTQSFNVIW